MSEPGRATTEGLLRELAPNVLGADGKRRGPSRCQLMTPTAMVHGPAVRARSSHAASFKGESVLHASHVRLREIASLEKHGLAGNPRQGIRAAVPDVEICRVLSSSKSPPGVPGHFDMGFGQRHAFQVNPVEQEIKLPAARLTFASFHNDGRFQNSEGTRKPEWIGGNGAGDPICLWFPEENGKKGGSIYNHQPGAPSLP